MNSRASIVPILLVLSFNLSAQQPRPADHLGSTQPSQATRPTAESNPQDLESWLNLAEGQTKEERLLSLGIGSGEAAEFARTSNSYARWYSVRSGSSEPNAILFLPCMLDDSYVCLLQLRNESWHVRDFEKLDCHYDMSVSIEIAPIRNAAVDEILVHDIGAGHGAGISTQDFNVFSIADGKLRLELDTEEVVKLYRVHNKPNDRYDLVQHSDFVLVPIHQSSSRVIEETRSVTINDKLKVERRQFRLDARNQRYAPSKFVPVEAALPK